MARLVVFDMDGVLADIESSWVFVHERFGVNNEESLYAYLRGEIDDLEFIRRDIGLWKAKDHHLDEGRIARILDEVPLMPGAKRTISELRARNYRTAIVSAGIDILARRISEECGIDLHIANGLERSPSGLLTGEGVLNVCLMDKGSAVVTAARKLGTRLEDTTSIGNSKYDVTMFERTGNSIAFHPSDDRVRSCAMHVVEDGDLTRVLQYL